VMCGDNQAQQRKADCQLAKHRNYTHDRGSECNRLVSSSTA
jgi:hypothetical protein